MRRTKGTNENDALRNCGFLLVARLKKESAATGILAEPPATKFCG